MNAATNQPSILILTLRLGQSDQVIHYRDLEKVAQRRFLHGQSEARANGSPLSDMIDH